MWNYIKRGCSINREMLVCKLLYLCFGGVVGTYAPYLHVFLCSIGFTPQQSGLLAGIRFVVSSCANPLWGYFADRTGHRKLTLVIMLLGAAVCVVPMPWVAYALQNRSLNSTTWNSTRNLSATVEPLDGPSHVAFNTTLYYVLMLMAAVSALFIIPLPGYLDTIGANAARNSVSKAGYGAQRIFGSVGSSISNYITGLASDHYHYSGMSPYTPSFYFLLLYLALTLPVGIRLISQGSSASKGTPDDTRTEQAPPPPNVCTLLWKMLKNPDAVFFYATLIVSGLCFNISIYFTLLLIEKEPKFHTSRAQNSFALVLASISNMVFFPLSGLIIKLLRGPTQAMMLAFATYIIRYMVMSYTTVFWLMIAVQALNGLTFALMWASAMEHVHKIAPKEIILTVFMMNSMVHFGICGLISNIAGGGIFHKYGGRMLFKSGALLCAGWLIIMIVYSVLRYFRRQHSDDMFPDEEGKTTCGGTTSSHKVDGETVTSVHSADVIRGNDEGCDNVVMEIEEPS